MSIAIAIGNLLVFGCALTTTLFPICYAVIAPWKDTRLGKALMLMSIATASLIDLTVLFALIGEFNQVWSLTIQVAVFAYTFAASTYLLVVLFGTQLEGRKARKAKKASSEDS